MTDLGLKPPEGFDDIENRIVAVDADIEQGQSEQSVPRKQPSSRVNRTTASSAAKTVTKNNSKRFIPN